MRVLTPPPATFLPAAGDARPYAPPRLTVVTFAAERGFATSGGNEDRTILDFLLNDPSESPSTGEPRSDEGYLF